LGTTSIGLEQRLIVDALELDPTLTVTATLTGDDTLTVTAPELSLGGTVADYLEPLTDGTLTVQVLVNDVPKDDATVKALVVYSPKGVSVATNVTMAAVGGNTGKYILNILAAWSSDSGKALEGEYVAVVEVVRSGTKRTRRIRYPVRWDDDN
jgi:hypothetical protein